MIFSVPVLSSIAFFIPASFALGSWSGGTPASSHRSHTPLWNTRARSPKSTRNLALSLPLPVALPARRGIGTAPTAPTLSSLHALTRKLTVFLSPLARSCWGPCGWRRGHVPRPQPRPPRLPHTPSALMWLQRLPNRPANRYTASTAAFTVSCPRCGSSPARGRAIAHSTPLLRRGVVDRGGGGGGGSGWHMA